MSRGIGVIGITPTGKYLYESSGGHLGSKKYAIVDDINGATLFVVLPKQKEYDVTPVIAYSERIVRIGEPPKE